MSRTCGFKFYKMKNGKLVREKAALVDYGEGPNLEDCISINGFTKVTDIFLEACLSKKRPSSCEIINIDLKPEEKYFPNLIFNHPELNGIELHYDKNTFLGECYGEWFEKFFYIDIGDFKKMFALNEQKNLIGDNETRNLNLEEKHILFIKKSFEYIDKLLKHDPELIVTAYGI